MSPNRNPRVTRGIAACLLAAAGLVAVEMSPLNDAHGDHWWHHLSGFDLIYGMVGCVVIVLASKAIGAAWLQRPETYYEERDG